MTPLTKEELAAELSRHARVDADIARWSLVQARVEDDHRDALELAVRAGVAAKRAGALFEACKAIGGGTHAKVALEAASEAARSALMCRVVATSKRRAA